MARAAALVFVALTVVACAARSPAAFDPGDARYRFDVALSRPAIGDGSATCTASVTDLDSKRVIRIAPFPVRPGDTARGGASDEATGARFEILVALDDSGERATYEASVRKNDRLVASRRAAVDISR